VLPKQTLTFIAIGLAKMQGELAAGHHLTISASDFMAQQLAFMLKLYPGRVGYQVTILPHVIN
jgi:hypothetical protein